MLRLFLRGPKGPDRNILRFHAIAAVIAFLMPMAAAGQVPGGGPSRGRSIENATFDSGEFSTRLQMRLLEATVRIHSAQGTGTGIVVGRDGEQCLIVTAWHVVDGGGAYKIEVFDYVRMANDIHDGAQLVGHNSMTDLALLRARIPPKSDLLAICPDGAEPQREFMGLSAGCDSPSPTLLMRSASGRVFHPRYTANFWVLEHGSMRGRSGGALIDARGYILGIYCMNVDGRGHYIESAAIRQLLVDSGYGHLVDRRVALPPAGTWLDLIARILGWFLFACVLLARQRPVALGWKSGFPLALFIQIALLSFVSVWMATDAAPGMWLIATPTIAAAQVLTVVLIGGKRNVGFQSPITYLPAIATAIALSGTTPLVSICVAAVAFLHLFAHVICGQRP